MNIVLDPFNIPYSKEVRPRRVSRFHFFFPTKHETQNEINKNISPKTSLKIKMDHFIKFLKITDFKFALPVFPYSIHVFTMNERPKTINWFPYQLMCTVCINTAGFSTSPKQDSRIISCLNIGYSSIATRNSLLDEIELPTLL